ncbi:hypothetical protein [Oceanobacillus picturae]|uniref:hypothetical protein n=1 Tax=Oceanobacillus picturae TaxID=171693 RepID=UPI0011C3EF3A|nr:hypothetical protein [Oceanobacillus picturae]
MLTSAQDTEDVAIKKENNILTINIKKEGEMYKVFKDDTLVYEGEKNVFSEKMDYSQQKYRIGIFEDSRLLEVIQVNIRNDENTKINKSRINNFNGGNKRQYIGDLIKETKLETITSTSGVTLNWNKIPDEDGVYEIYKNDKKIAETIDLSYTDSNVVAGENYYYTVKIKNKLTEEEEDQLIRDNKENENFSSEELKEKVNELRYGGTLNTLVKVPDNNKQYLENDLLMDSFLNDNEKANIAANVPMFFDVTYRTFIPYNSVENPNPFSGANYLKGDNRSSFQAYTDKYRTEARVYAQFDYPPALKLWSDVNATYSCETSTCQDTNYEGTASTSGIDLRIVKEQRNDLQWRVIHGVPIPLTGPYPEIDYGYAVQASPNHFSAVGNHDEAPNHELWLNSPGESIRIYGFKVASKKDFWKLWGIKESWSFDM